MRKYHILTRNHAQQAPSRIIFYDTESDLLPVQDSNITRHRFKMVTACYVRLEKREIARERWVTTDRIEEFHDFILANTNTKSRLYIVAHNQHYDMITAKMLPFLEKNRFRIKTMIIDSGRVIVSANNGSRSIVFIDSFNFFKTSLAEIGKVLGLEKLKMPENNDEKEWERYNRQDVEILKQYFLKYMRWVYDSNLGNFGFTLPSQSFNAFRHRFMTDEIHIHDNADAIQYERNSFHGGRTEAFRIGDFTGDFHVLDFNSMYPAQMKDNQYPVRLLGRLYPNCDILKKTEKYCIVARVIVDTKEPVFGKVHNGKLVFPVGRFETYITTPEIRYAIENNIKIRILDGYVYEKSNIFESFVKYMYEKREECKVSKDVIGSNFYKLIMNSLFGKFAQRITAWEKYGKMKGYTGYGKYYDSDRKEMRLIRYVNGEGWIEKNQEESYNSFCCIASHVTAYARIALWKSIKKAGLENVYYCDTDSLFVNRDGYNNLLTDLDDYRLGALKHEKKVSHLVIRGLKDYEMDGYVKLKGVPLRNKNTIKLDENSYSITVFPKLKTMIRKSSTGEYFTYVTKKTLSREYTKGTVSNTFVNPLIINE